MRFRICCFPALVLASTAPAHATITISTGSTQNMSCAAGVCEPTAATAVLNVKDLEALLASGNTKVTTTSSAGVQATDIRIARNLSWSGSTSLTLDAFRSVTIDGRVNAKGRGAFAVLINDGGSKGAFAFGSGGSLAFANLSSPLTINGVSYALVSSVASLAGAIAASPSGAFALANSYDASQDGTYTSAPIPTVFTGSFNGLGNTISNLTINDPTGNAYVGLFAEISGNATLSDLKLVDLNVTGGSGSSLGSSAEFVGGLAGFAVGGTITHVIGSGTVSAGEYASAGGLAGEGGTMESSGADISVSIGFLGQAGGLAGGTYGTVSDSYATGSVSGSGFVGGLVGFSATIDHSFATGTVTGVDTYTYAGGLVGIDQGAVVRSFASGAVSCDLACGGLAGMSGGGFASTISRSFATGAVSANAGGAGGLVGDNVGSLIADCYATGSASGKGAGGLVAINAPNAFGGIRSSYSSGAVTAAAYAGGLIAVDLYTGSLKRDYWDTTTSGIWDEAHGAGNVLNDPGIKGLSNAKLQSGLPRGFSPRVWTEDPNVNGGLPYLIANSPPKQVAEATGITHMGAERLDTIFPGDQERYRRARASHAVTRRSKRA